jgi:hypothetical protein
LVVVLFQQRCWWLSQFRVVGREGWWFVSSKLDATRLATKHVCFIFDSFFLYFFFSLFVSKTQSLASFHQFEDEAVQHELIPRHDAAQLSGDPSLPASLCSSTILFNAPPSTHRLANPWHAAIVEHRREAI